MKTCDIVFVQPHYRGFNAGKVYPISAYWRGNGSAYRGSHSPFVAGSFRKEAGARKDTIGFESSLIAAPEMQDLIKENMNNCEPAVFVRRVMSVNEDGTRKTDLDWLKENEEQIARIVAACEYDPVRKPIYQLDPVNGGYLRDENGNKIVREEGCNGVLHTSPGGSTVAIDARGRIGAITIGDEKDYSWRTMLAKAVSAGGYKYDAYEADHEALVAAGFIPVAWVKTEKKDYPEGFDPSKDFSCDRIYYVHATHCREEDIERASNLLLGEWKEQVRPNRSDKEAVELSDDYAAGEAKILFADNRKEERRQYRALPKTPIETLFLLARKKSKEERAHIKESNWSNWESNDSFKYKDDLDYDEIISVA